MSKQYIALQAIQFVDENGTRVSVEPRSDKHSGLFEHTFDKKAERRLFNLGALREPEGTEEHEDLTKVESLHDSRDIDGKADPLDHDANGKKGGSKPRKAKAAAAPAAETPAEDPVVEPEAEAAAEDDLLDT